MRSVLIILIAFFSFSAFPSYVDAESLKSNHDYVKIGYIPSRGSAYKGEPYIDLHAEALAHHKNQEIEMFYEDIKNISLNGIVDNSTRFHQPTIYIEVVYQGDSIRLSYAGDSEDKNFESYEEQWTKLHNKIFQFLINNIKPKF